MVNLKYHLRSTSPMWCSCLAAPSYQGLLKKTEMTELTELTERVHVIDGCVQCEAEVLHCSAHMPALARTSLRFPAFPRSARSLSAAFPRFPAFPDFALDFATFLRCEHSALRPVLGHSCHGTAPMYFSCSPGPCLLVYTLFSI